MTAPATPRLEGQPTPSTGPRAAGPATPRRAVGQPKGAARKGDRSALVSNADAVVITGITPGLQVRCSHPPVADWLCSCGHHERARGRAAVIELTTRVTVDVCPHTAATHEGRVAA